MAITSAQQASIIKLAVGMFNAAPGGFMSDLALAFEAGGSSLVNLANNLANTSAFKGQSFAYSSASTNEQFAQAFVNNLLGSASTASTNTMAYDFVLAKLNAGTTRGATMNDAINALDAVATTDTTWGTAAALLDNRVAVATHYTVDLGGSSTDLTALMNTISSVTSDPATVTTANASSDANVAGANAKTVTLTINPDIVGTAASVATALLVGAANDTIIGFVGTAAFSGTTLSNADSIGGGEGTDTLMVTLANSGTENVTPVMSSIEVVNIRAVSDTTARMTLSNATSVTAIEISGTSDLDLEGLNNGAKVTFSGSFTNTATLEIASETTADSVTLNLNQGNSAALRDGEVNTASGIETINLVANTAFGVGNGSVFDFQHASALNISGTANVTLNFAAGSGNFGVTATGLSSGNMVDRLASVNASALQGNLTLYLGSGSVDMTVVGGIGNDTFYASAQFNQSDSLDAGAGTDTLSWAILNSGTYRPVIQGVETLTVDLNNDAVIDLRNSSAATISTLNVFGEDTGATFSALSSATTSINVYSGASAGGLTFNYGSGGASDVVMNLSNHATATSTASYNMGDLVFGNNTGSLTLNVAGTATGHDIEAFSANNLSTLTVNVNCGQLRVFSAFNANGAKTVTLNVNNGETASFTACAASFTSVTALAINVSGATANADFDDIFLGANGNMTVTLGSQATAFTMGTAKWGVTAQTAAMTAAGLTIVNNGNGDVTFSGLDLTTAAAGSAGEISASLTFNLSVSQTGTGAAFALGGLELGTALSANLSITLAGQGSFEITASGSWSSVSTSQVVFNSTAVATGAGLTATFTAIADAEIKFDVRLGGHSGLLTLGAGADTVQFGLGTGMSVRGGDGADELTMNNSAVSIAAYNNTGSAGASKDDGADTIFGAGTGDIILFNDYACGTAGKSNMLHSAITTGTGSMVVTTAANSTAQIWGTSFIGQLAGGTAVATSLQFMAMYTAAGDMIIEVLLATASGGATGAVYATGDVTTIVLNGKGDVGKTSLLRLDVVNSALQLTLL